MSDRSYRKYRRWRHLVRPVLANIDCLLVQTDRDRERLLGLGVPPRKVTVAGNLKAEVRLPEWTPEERSRLRADFGLSPDRKVIVAGSTHRGEEAIVLKAFIVAREVRPELVLVIAPRHPERSAELEGTALEMGLRVMRRTRPEPRRSWDVLILDTIGSWVFYALGDWPLWVKPVPRRAELARAGPLRKPLLRVSYGEFRALADDLWLRRGQVVAGPAELGGGFR
jgi:3-deoxy-D-manno-octulosonic-acid transferase